MRDTPLVCDDCLTNWVIPWHHDSLSRSTAEYGATLLRMRRSWTNNVIVQKLSALPGQAFRFLNLENLACLKREDWFECPTLVPVRYMRAAGSWRKERERGLYYADHDCIVPKVTTVLPQCLFSDGKEVSLLGEITQTKVFA